MLILFNTYDDFGVKKPCILNYVTGAIIVEKIIKVKKEEFPKIAGDLEEGQLFKQQVEYCMNQNIREGTILIGNYIKYNNIEELRSQYDTVVTKLYEKLSKDKPIDITGFELINK